MQASSECSVSRLASLRVLVNRFDSDAFWSSHRLRRPRSDSGTAAKIRSGQLSDKGDILCSLDPSPRDTLRWCVEPGDLLVACEPEVPGSAYPPLSIGKS